MAAVVSIGGVQLEQEHTGFWCNVGILAGSFCPSTQFPLTILEEFHGRIAWSWIVLHPSWERATLASLGSRRQFANHLTGTVGCLGPERCVVSERAVTRILQGYIRSASKFDS
jgi:hypothetical protein